MVHRLLSRYAEGGRNVSQDRYATTYAIYSVTSNADMNGGEVSNPADFDVTKLTYTLS